MVIAHHNVQVGGSCDALVMSGPQTIIDIFYSGKYDYDFPASTVTMKRLHIDCTLDIFRAFHHGGCALPPFTNQPKNMGFIRTPPCAFPNRNYRVSALANSYADRPSERSSLHTLLRASHRHSCTANPNPQLQYSSERRLLSVLTSKTYCRPLPIIPKFCAVATAILFSKNGLNSTCRTTRQ